MPSAGVCFGGACTDGTQYSLFTASSMLAVYPNEGTFAGGLFPLAARDTLSDGVANFNHNPGGGLPRVVPLAVEPYPYLYNGATWDRQKSVDATSLTETISTGAALVAPLSTWSVTHTPAVATQATASKTLGAAGVRHVATTITACLGTNVTLQTPIIVNLRDGASGAGTILRSWVFALPINSSNCVNVSDLAIIGTAATAMTLEFEAAGVANSQATVTLTGYSVN